MRAILNHVRRQPTLLLYVVIAWIGFALITTILSTYPLLSEYALRSPHVFAHWETWSSFLDYTYNPLIGGLVNYLNTFLFGIWILCFAVYRKTYIQQGITISTKFNVHHSGTVGGVAALLGGGCIGCGFTFLTNIFGATLGLFLNSLPLKGAELSIVGALIIILSIIRLSRQVDEFQPELPAQSETPPSTMTPSGMNPGVPV